MLASAERMQVFVEGLLSLSRHREGRRFVPVDLGEIVRNVVADLEVQISKAYALQELLHYQVRRRARPREGLRGRGQGREHTRAWHP